VTAPNLLLVSSSVTHGTGYLDHCEDAVRAHFAGAEKILFVPYALHDRDGYAAKACGRFAEMGITCTSIHEAADPVAAVRETDGVFIGGGNTFRLLKTLCDLGLVGPLRERVAGGMPYMGTSAGSNVAGLTIRTTNDMPIVEPPSFEALALAPIQLNPHYLDHDPDSRHQGESRDQRLREYLEENEGPVIAIREGAWLVIRGESISLGGANGGKIFRADGEIEDISAGPIAP
jgi:dipeptidase E